jgi:hypothetical protein
VPREASQERTHAVVPSWILPSLLIAYVSAALIFAFAAAFSHEAERRSAAYDVLRLMLPWILLVAAAEVWTGHRIAGVPRTTPECSDQATKRGTHEVETDHTAVG